jgi:hypothetical protein
VIGVPPFSALSKDQLIYIFELETVVKVRLSGLPGIVAGIISM